MSFETENNSQLCPIVLPPPLNSDGQVFLVEGKGRTILASLSVSAHLVVSIQSRLNMITAKFLRLSALN